MKNLFNQIKTYGHKLTLRAYIHARNAFLRDRAKWNTDGTPDTAFAPGPHHPLP